MESLLLFFVLIIVVFTYFYCAISKKIAQLKLLDFKTKLFTNQLNENYEKESDYYAVVFKRENSQEPWIQASELVKQYNSFLTPDQKTLFNKKFDQDPSLDEKFSAVKSDLNSLSSKKIMFNFQLSSKNGGL